jgi:hypothetical protein
MAGRYSGSYLERSNGWRAAAILADIAQASLVRRIPQAINYDFADLAARCLPLLQVLLRGVQRAGGQSQWMSQKTNSLGPRAVRVSKISPLLLLNQSVYWNILWGVYISGAAPAAVGWQGRQGLISEDSDDAAGRESTTLLGARSRCGSGVDRCQAVELHHR